MIGIDLALVAGPDSAALVAELGRMTRSVLRLDPLTVVDGRFATHDDATLQPAVVLFGPELDRLLQVARAARRQWPSASLVFLSGERGDASVRRALGPAPMLGKDWHVLNAGQANLSDDIVRIASVARRQRQFRSTLDEANLRLQSSRAVKGTEHRKLEVVDSYLASFLSYAQDAIIGVDLERNIVFWSAGAQRLLGLTRTQALGQPVAVLPIFSAALQAAMTRTVVNHAVTIFEGEVLIAGTVMTVEIVITNVVGDSEEVLGLTLVLRDITLRRQALASERDAALRSGQRANAERRHLRQLFQHAPGFVLVTEGSSHRIELANDGFFELTATKQLVGHEVRAVFPAALADAISSTMDAVYADGLSRTISDLAVSAPTGCREHDPPQRRHVDFVFQPLQDDAGAVTGVFCQGHDVTRKVHAEAALQRSQRALEQALAAQSTQLHSTQRALEQSQKLEAIGKLTGGVSHDFNNVLQIIGANLQLLRRAMPGEQAPLKRVASALEAVDRGAKLSSQLLAFARKQPLAPQALDMGRRLRAMDDLLRRALGETIEIEISVSARLWTAMADPHQLENVVLNLALNARDAMPLGGKLTIEASNATLDEAYAASEAEVAAGAYVLLAVSDTDTACRLKPWHTRSIRFSRPKERGSARPWTEHGIWLREAEQWSYQAL